MKGRAGPKNRGGGGSLRLAHRRCPHASPSRSLCRFYALLRPAMRQLQAEKRPFCAKTTPRRTLCALTQHNAPARPYPRAPRWPSQAPISAFPSGKPKGQRKRPRSTVRPCASLPCLPSDRVPLYRPITHEAASSCFIPFILVPSEGNEAPNWYSQGQKRDAEAGRIAPAPRISPSVASR